MKREQKDRKIKPNNRCPCGSGKKYKHCHGMQEHLQTKEANHHNYTMGIFKQYISQKLDLPKIESLRRDQLKNIGTLLDCDVITYAARLSNVPFPNINVGVSYEDMLPFTDLLSSTSSKRIAVIIETFGGAGEVGRDMVEFLHDKYEHVSFIVPGVAKSTGTIMVLGGHEIYMGPSSALGPIDAQIIQDGKRYSADALIEGMNRIKAEVETTGNLNKAYIPFLSKLSPGEIEHAHNALEFARTTVREWLVKYKFGNWDHRATSGEVVTEEYKHRRASEISTELCRQSRWHTHSRSLRINDLRDLGLRIRDYTEEPKLYEAIHRYNVLLRMTFDSSNAYKIFETQNDVIVQRFTLNQPARKQKTVIPPGADAKSAAIKGRCPNCREEFKAQVNFTHGLPAKDGAQILPPSGILSCKNCGTDIDLTSARGNIEQQVGKKIIP